MDTLQAKLPPSALIAGCGDIGLRVARRLRALGREVTAIVRDRQKAAPLAALGAWLRIEDLDAPADVGDVPLLFWFAPPPDSGERDARLRGWLAAQRGRIDRVVYISTSAVYGDCGGRWIDEDEPLAPRSARGQRRADAERALLEAQAQGGAAAVILRVPGIYGPGRLPLERLRRGLPVLRAAESPYSNRIHADDLAEAALHAAAFGRGGRAYHVADGAPTTMADYFMRCARLLDLPEPPQLAFEDARRALTPAMWSFMEESKRLRTERLREELHFSPRYPDLESGLPACLAAEDTVRTKGVA
ncbi:NAD-dependent epimerase/dehydratase family protein [Solimonas variicoloris]|uniref:NAD-dependent epimerase/dehydratase family protein n=1 Tax=Solimonas variicoloris TaxID=254408 RepID=UPI0003769C37|nr:NAD-dependent epimerase/dehydratase family protein [Solimonas variicoloris]